VLLTAVPWACAALTHLFNSMHSQRVGERRWHICVPWMAGSICLYCLATAADAGKVGAAAISEYRLAAQGDGWFHPHVLPGDPPPMPARWVLPCRNAVNQRVLPLPTCCWPTEASTADLLPPSCFIRSPAPAARGKQASQLPSFRLLRRRSLPSWCSSWLSWVSTALMGRTSAG
jgi:hypothetical protein